MPSLTLDKTDLRILAELQLNGRLTNVELAERVALSPSPCLRRLKQLEESGAISQYVALLDPGKIGLGLQAFVRVMLEKRGNSHNQSFIQRRESAARSDQLLRHDRRNGLFTASLFRRYGTLLAFCHERAVATARRGRCEIQLCPERSNDLFHPIQFRSAEAR